METDSNVSHPYNRMCAISAMLPAGDSYLEGSTSGILVDAKQGLVLTHASLLYPFVEQFRQEKYDKLLSVGYSNQAIIPHQLKIEVFFPNSYHSNDNISVNENFIHPVQVLGKNVQDISPYVKCSGKLKSVFVCKKLQDTLHTLTPRQSWQLAGDVSSGSNNNTDASTNENLSTKKEEMCYQLLPYFVLIKLPNLQVKESATLSLRTSVDNQPGDTVEICATPFGTMSPDVFLNSRSRGIISKLAGPQNVLLFTDARCVPGSEGGGVFYCHRGKRTLTAIVIASLCWKANEWVGLSMACGISEVLATLQSNYVQDTDEVLNTEYTTGYHGNRLISQLMDSTVYVTVGASWGSGVVLDAKQGVILTCSHVLKGADYRGVCVSSTTSNEDLQCTILYRSPLKSQFDIALIKTKNVEAFNHEAAHTTFGRAIEGDVVYVIGHAIFRGTNNQYPMVTRGIISKIVTYNNVPVLIQTTCAVHAGASGGGVFNTRGQLVALVVCNSRDTLSGASYPHVNLCIPVETIASVLKRYLNTKDASILKLLHVKNTTLSRLWSIGTEEAVTQSQL